MARRVKVYNGKGSGGSIEIEFFGKDDLKSLQSSLKHLNNLNFNFRRKKMLDIKLVRENPDLVKENIKKKFQEEKLALVDEVIELDKKFRESKQRADELRASRNKISKEIGGLMAKGLREERKRQNKRLRISQRSLKSSRAARKHSPQKSKENDGYT